MNTELMKQRRRELGIDQRQTAAAIGVSIASYRGYEQGVREPRTPVLRRLAEVLDVTIDELLGHEVHQITLLDSVTQRAADLTDPEKYDVLRFIDYLIHSRPR